MYPNRSVAILPRSSPERLEPGSGVCVRIGERYLVATVKHNFQDDNAPPLKISDLELRPGGEKYGDALKIQRMGLSPTQDLAWLELDPASARRTPLAFVTGDQIAFLDEDADRQHCRFVGYPAQLAETPTTAQHRPLVESTALLTLSIAPGVGRARETTELYFPSRERVRTSLPARVMREGKLVYAA
jgi:hypothetical protein